jgi:hypothetical protein
MVFLLYLVGRVFYRGLQRIQGQTPNTYGFTERIAKTSRSF